MSKPFLGGTEMRQQTLVFPVAVFCISCVLAGPNLAGDHYYNVPVHPSSDIHQSETYVAINPTDPSNILIGANTHDSLYARTEYWQGYYYSTTGGVSWSGSDSLPQSYHGGDPVVGFNSLSWIPTWSITVNRHCR